MNATEKLKIEASIDQKKAYFERMIELLEQLVAK